MTFFKSALSAALLAAIFYSCTQTSPQVKPPSRGEAIVDSAIAYHGGSLYESLDVSFGFRQKEYHVKRKSGRFEYTNTYRDTLGLRVRKLTNDGYTETLDGERVELTDKLTAARSASVNSVVYFALLPGMLNTAAANKAYIGKETIEGADFYKVRVTFSEEGGGEDYEDVFLYWFSTDDYAMDYLAYSYLEEEGGSRFRKAYNRRSVNGLVFQDYLNMRGPAPDSLEFISEIFKSGRLDTLSVIEVDRLRVTAIE